MYRRPRDEYLFGLSQKLAQPLRGSIAAPLAGTRRRMSAPYVGPLDYRPGALGVMGTRLFYTAYTGPALRVRNPDTNVESDISFGADGKLNASEIAAAKGASSTLPVAKVYVQDASGNDYVQATASKQPLLTQNGPDDEWCLEFDGTDDWIEATIASTSQPFSRYLAFNPLVWEGFGYVLDAHTNDRAPFLMVNGSPRIGFYAGAALYDVEYPLETWSVATQVGNGASSTLRRNKLTALTGDAGSNSINSVIIGGQGGGGQVPTNIRVIGIAVFNAADDTAAQNAVIEAFAAAAGITL